MGRPKASTNLFDMPSRKPRQKKAAAKRRGEPEMVADTLQLLVLAHALEFGADIAVEDRRWLAARLRSWLWATTRRRSFFPGIERAKARPNCATSPWLSPTNIESSRSSEKAWKSRKPMRSPGPRLLMA